MVETGVKLTMWQKLSLKQAWKKLKKQQAKNKVKKKIQKYEKNIVKSKEMMIVLTELFDITKDDDTLYTSADIMNLSSEATEELLEDVVEQMRNLIR